jgi:hypothetical protein
MPDGEPVSPAELGLALMSRYPVGVRGDIVLAVPPTRVCIMRGPE